MGQCEPRNRPLAGRAAIGFGEPPRQSRRGRLVGFRVGLVASRAGRSSRGCSELLRRRGTRGSEPAPETKESEARELTVPAVTPGEVTFAASDPGELNRDVDFPDAVEQLVQHGDTVGMEAGRTETTPHCDDPSTDPTNTEADGHEPPTSRGRAAPAIDGYEILGELGRGGMGVVYRARQVRLNRPCALKMILAGGHADTLATVRFLAEAEVVARLQ